MSNSGKMVGVGPYSADLAAIKSLLTLRREARRKWMPWGKKMQGWRGRY